MALVLRTCRRLLPPLQQQAFSSLIERWPDASEPIERARTPPASWYTDRAVLRAEEARVFRRHWQVMMLWPAAWVWLPEWLSAPSGRGLDLCMPRRAAPQAVGHVQQVEGAGDYFTGSLLGQGYVVCRDDEGQLRAFYNVRREGRRAFLSVSAKVCGAAPLVQLAIGPRDDDAGAVPQVPCASPRVAGLPAPRLPGGRRRGLHAALHLPLSRVDVPARRPAASGAASRGHRALQGG